MKEKHRQKNIIVNTGWTPFNKWAKITGISRTTALRWRVAGLIRPTNILGRLYLSDTEIERFTRRALAGEFETPIVAEGAKENECSGNMPKHLAEARGLISFRHLCDNTATEGKGVL